MTFFISLTGLNAAQTELSALSNNIANVGTSGFKKSSIQFGDIVSRSSTQAANQVNGAGVAVTMVKQQFTQGGRQGSSNSLDMSIGGQGFFLVKGGGDAADSLALSRNGSFSVDAENWVVDNEGRRLQVLPTTTDGAVTAVGASALQALRIPTSSGDPRATTNVQFTANLPTGATAPVSAFDRTNGDSYTAATSMAVYDTDGNASTATIYYRRIESPIGDTNKYWEVHGFIGDNPISPVPGPGPVQLSFDANGVMLAPLGNTTTDAGFSLNFDGTSMQARPFSVPFSDQDGYAPGRLEGVGVDIAGVVRASFSNGETQAIGKLALGNVANPQGLRQIGNVSWTVSPTSGDLLVGQGAQDGFGTITAGSLERSNVDLTEELVGLISAQRNFQANAKAIDTSSTLLQTIIQLRG